MIAVPLSLQELSPASARFCLKIKKSLEKFFTPGKKHHLLIALSGGADSTALAVVMRILAKRMGFSLNAIHINHQLRAAARQDEEFVLDLCAKLNIPCAFFKFNAKKFAENKGCGLEEAGHIARLNLIDSYSDEIGAERVLLAHHASDLAEDIIMRILRGSAWPALGGMRMKAAKIFRPFLYVSAAELRSFLTRENISWREDETNKSDKFLRNRVRHDIIPLLLRENPEFWQKVQELNLFSEIDRDYWEQKLKNFFADVKVTFQPDQICVVLDKKEIRSQNKAFRLRIYSHAVKMLVETGKVSGQARASTLFLLDEALMAGRSPKIFQLPGNIEIILNNGEMRFRFLACRQ